MIRTALLIGALAVPALGSAAFFTRFTLHRAHPAPRPAPDAAALAQAVASGDVLRAFVMVDAGADTNQPRRFSHRSLTGDAEVLVTPLMLGAARADENMVRMLLTYAAEPRPDQRWQASCLAASKGDEGLANLIASGQPPSEPCPAGLDTQRLLQAFTARLEGQ